MSRIGGRPIKIEESVSVEANSKLVKVSCGESVIEFPIPDLITVETAADTVTVSRQNDSKEAKSLHGLTARLIKNMITGVKDQFKQVLEFNGTGYRAVVEGESLILNMGYSHEIRLSIPERLKVSIVKNNITIAGIRKEEVGEFAARIRRVRPPEVYKGKGIKYKNERIRRKAGKTAASK